MVAVADRIHMAAGGAIERRGSELFDPCTCCPTDLRARAIDDHCDQIRTHAPTTFRRRLPAIPLLSEAVRVTSVQEQSSICLGSTLPPDATLRRTEMRHAPRRAGARRVRVRHST